MDPINIDTQEEMHGVEIIPRVTRRVYPLLDQLLLGFSNNVTLRYIAPEFPRRAYETVSKLSPDWQRVLQSGMVYYARVRNHMTQEFLLVSCKLLTTIRDNNFPEKCIQKQTLSLFSPSEGRWYKIPPIPGCHEGVLHNSYLWAILDGSLYLLGGTRSRKAIDIPSAEVLVLDLARYPLEWRQCASMQVARLRFKVRVMNGKIFVFGGRASSGNFQVRNEVYDPTADAWSFIAPTTPLVSIRKAFSIAKQLFLCARSIPIHPPNDFSRVDDIYTQFVVTVDDRGPKIRSTSDVDAEDDMDGLHEIIKTELADVSSVPSQRSHPQRIAAFRAHQPYVGIYDPVKDQWRACDMEILENATVTEYGTNHVFILRKDHIGSDSDDDEPEPGGDRSDQDKDGPDPNDQVLAYVWSITL